MSPVWVLLERHLFHSGLFRGAIQQSGSPLNEWGFIANPKPYVASLIEQIDGNAYVGEDSQAQLQYLQNAAASAIDAASKLTTPVSNCVALFSLGR